MIRKSRKIIKGEIKVWTTMFNLANDLSKEIGINELQDRQLEDLVDAVNFVWSYNPHNSFELVNCIANNLGGKNKYLFLNKVIPKLENNELYEQELKTNSASHLILKWEKWLEGNTGLADS